MSALTPGGGLLFAATGLSTGSDLPAAPAAAESATAAGTSSTRASGTSDGATGNAATSGAQVPRDDVQAGFGLAR